MVPGIFLPSSFRIYAEQLQLVPFFLFYPILSSVKRGTMYTHAGMETGVCVSHMVPGLLLLG